MVGSRGCLRSGRGALYLLDSPGPVVGRVFSLRDAPSVNSPPTKPPTALRIASNRANHHQSPRLFGPYLNHRGSNTVQLGRSEEIPGNEPVSGCAIVLAAWLGTPQESPRMRTST